MNRLDYIDRQWKYLSSDKAQDVNWLIAEVKRLREWASSHMCEDRIDSYGAEIWDHEDGQPIPRPDCGTCTPCEARKALEK